MLHIITHFQVCSQDCENCEVHNVHKQSTNDLRFPIHPLEVTIKVYTCMSRDGVLILYNTNPYICQYVLVIAISGWTCNFNNTVKMWFILFRWYKWYAIFNISCHIWNLIYFQHFCHNLTFITQNNTYQYK